MAYGSNQKNVTTRVEGDKLVIEIDLTQDHGPSTSGRTHVVATSDGITYVEVNGVKWTLSVGLWKPINRNGGK